MFRFSSRPAMASVSLVLTAWAFSPAPAGPEGAGMAVELDGVGSYISTSRQYVNPSEFTLALWFKTSTSAGGKLAGFQESQAGDGSRARNNRVPGPVTRSPAPPVNGTGS